MPEPSADEFGAPARRPVGRLGLFVLLALGVVALAVMTQAEAADRAGPDTATGPGAPTDTDAPSHPLAFGSTTASGAIVFRLGDTVHAWSVDDAGTVRWQRDLLPSEYLVCGPCPAAIVEHDGGRASTIAADGSSGAAPVDLDGGLVDTTSIAGVVLAAARPDRRVEFYVTTSAGLVSAGELADARLDQPLVVVTPATGAGAVTLMRPSADALRQAEFEVVHVTPAGSHVLTVALDAPGARPLPCVVADADSVAYVQQLRGPTSAGSTHVVRRTDAGSLAEATVTGSFDACVAGPQGVVLATSVTGADGDPSHTEIELIWLDGSLAVAAHTTETVVSSTPSVAIDPRTDRVAVAGGTGSSVLLGIGSRRERPPAAAVAFDDLGGLWSIDTELHVTHEATP
jgi:hypothetical protein